MTKRDPMALKGDTSRYRLLEAVLVFVMTLFGATSYAGEALQPVASLVVFPIAPIQPVPVADGRNHLVYELLLVNQDVFAATIESLSVSDPESGKTLMQLQEADLASALRLSPLGGKGAVIQPSQSAMVFLDVSLTSGEALPTSIRHTIEITQALATEQRSAEVGGLPIKLAVPSQTSVTFNTEPVQTDLSASAAIASPVRGRNWIMFRSCCALATSHRGTTAAYDGILLAPERYAIDLVQTTDDGRLMTGPGDLLSSYIHYGAPVHAVAEGTVISARNSEPDHTPGMLADGIAAEMAGGNIVLIDMGSNRFAYYAHLKPGSVRVSAGDRVKSGQIIGQIGNSGKSFGPHLHFHITDRPSGSAADGVPYVFNSFTGQGVLSPDALAMAMQGQTAPMDRNLYAGPHANELPVNNQIVDFGR